MENGKKTATLFHFNSRTAKAQGAKHLTTTKTISQGGIFGLYLWLTSTSSFSVSPAASLANTAGVSGRRCGGNASASVSASASTSASALDKSSSSSLALVLWQAGGEGKKCGCQNAKNSQSQAETNVKQM